VLNNFTTDSKHSKLMTTMFQNMFPSINIHTVSLFVLVHVRALYTPVISSKLGDGVELYLDQTVASVPDSFTDVIL